MANKLAPAWLTSELFTQIIAKKYKNFDRIQKFRITAALDNFENSFTRLLRISIKFKLKDRTCKTESFILKIPCSSDYRLLFLYENDMYKNIVQELQEICLAAHLTDVILKAKTFELPVCDDEISDYILMEDLTAHNFERAQMSRGLNEVETRLVLLKLAQWHAASMKRVEDFGIYGEAYCDSYFIEEEKQTIGNINELFQKPFWEALKQTNLEKDFKKKTIYYMLNLTDLQLEAAKINPQQLNVLNHGDLWLGNLMFQYDADKNLSDVIFIDFQMPKYGNPAQDLFWLLISSTAWEIKLNKFEQFVEFYHGALISHLRLLNYRKSLPSLTDLHESMRAGSVWAFIAAQRLLPIALMDPYENSNIEAFMDTGILGWGTRTRLLTNPKYVSQLEEILRFLRSYVG